MNCVSKLQIRGHNVAELDPLEISRVRNADSEEEARKLLSTYRYHTIYNLGKMFTCIKLICGEKWRLLRFYTNRC